MPRLEMIRDIYADVGWRVEDVQEIKPSWTHEQCVEFLKKHEKRIESAMVSAGRDVIDFEIYRS